MTNVITVLQQLHCRPSAHHRNQLQVVASGAAAAAAAAVPFLKCKQAETGRIALHLPLSRPAVGIGVPLAKASRGGLAAAVAEPASVVPPVGRQELSRRANSWCVVREPAGRLWAHKQRTIPTPAATRG